MPSDKAKTIEALRKLANDTSTTMEERSAAKNAIKALGGDAADSIVSVQSEGTLVGQIELAKFKMPEWKNDIRYHPCPHSKIVRGINDRMFGGSQNRQNQTHNAFSKYETYRGADYRQVQRDGFILEQYIGLGIMQIWVSLVGEIDERFYTKGLHEDDRAIEIYSGASIGGWRDGPWWNELSDVLIRWSQEADAMDVAYAQKLAAEKQAEQNKKDDLFSRYIRRKG